MSILNPILFNNHFVFSNDNKMCVSNKILIITFLNVGYGDAILIQKGNSASLIDTGDNNVSEVDRIFKPDATTTICGDSTTTYDAATLELGHGYTSVRNANKNYDSIKLNKRYAVNEAFEKRNITVLDNLIVTHPHTDHHHNAPLMCGVQTDTLYPFLNNVSVKSYYDNGLLRSGLYASIRSAWSLESNWKNHMKCIFSNKPTRTNLENFSYKNTIQGVSKKYNYTETLRPADIDRMENCTSTVKIADGVKFTALWPPWEFIAQNQLDLNANQDKIMAEKDLKQHRYISSSHINCTSIVGKLTYGNFSILLTGDADSNYTTTNQTIASGNGIETLKATESTPLRESWPGAVWGTLNESVKNGDLPLSDINSTIYKAAHHGVRRNNCGDLMSSLKPEVYVASSYNIGMNEVIFNGTASILAGKKGYLSLDKYHMYNTSQHGNITIITDGTSYQVIPEKYNTHWDLHIKRLWDDKPT